MTWGEIKLAALQLMFSNEGTMLKKDDANREYLDAMPSSANAALSIITAISAPLLKKLTVQVDTVAMEPLLEEGVLTIPVTTGGVARVDMAACCDDYRALTVGELYQEAGGVYGVADGWSVEGEDVLCLPVGAPCTYTVYYRAYPIQLTAQTEDATELGVSREAAELVPLFIASQLYRDDDIQMSTQFRNEFEDGLNKLQYANSLRPAGGGGTVKNVTGWW